MQFRLFLLSLRRCRQLSGGSTLLVALAAIIIQSLFALINGEGPPPGEIDAYILLLPDLKELGAQISMGQINSATRPMAHRNCGAFAAEKIYRGSDNALEWRRD